MLPAQPVLPAAHCCRSFLGLAGCAWDRQMFGAEA